MREDSSSDTDSGNARFLPLGSLAGSLMIKAVAVEPLVARRLRDTCQTWLGDVEVKGHTAWLHARKGTRWMSLWLYLSSYHDLVSTHTVEWGSSIASLAQQSSWKHTKLCSTVASSFSLSFPFSRAALRRVLERSARSVWWCDPFDDAACGCKLELDAAWFPSKSIEFRPPWTSNVYNNQPKLCVPASRRRRSRCRAYSQCVEERDDFSLRLLGYLYYNYCGVSICGDFPIPSPL